MNATVVAQCYGSVAQAGEVAAPATPAAGAGRNDDTRPRQARARLEYSPGMLFMVVERFKNRDARAVYARAREKGRMLPDGLTYVASWVETNFDRCFQLMETQDAALLERWAERWRDLVEFEFVPVVTSAEAVRLAE
jgi:hypothetical protein